MAANRNTKPAPALQHQTGYTLLEALVTLFIVAEILVAVLVLFDFNTKVGRAQMQVAEAQQSVRVAQNVLVRTVRMAGRGGLGQAGLPGPVGTPLPNIPGGLAISLQSNVADGTEVAPGLADSPLALAGTDILTVRGAIENRIGFLSYGPATPANPDGGPNVVIDSIDTGRFFIPRVWRPIGMENVIGGAEVDQDLAPFIDAVNNNRTEAVLITSRADPSIFGLVELNPGTSDVSGDPLVIGFRFGGTPYSNGLNTVVPFGPMMTAANGNALSALILEEYRFFVRVPDGGLDAGAGRRGPALTVARMLPFSNLPHAGDNTNLTIEIAENVWNLQVALGIDLDRNGVIADGEVTAGLDPGADEWLYNDEDDDDSVVLWNTVPRAPLRTVRVTTLALTDRPDLKYAAPRAGRIEDRIYAAGDPLNSPMMVQFRRRAVQTNVDLRGL